MLIYLFASSLIALVILISIKMYENALKRRIYVMELLSRLDEPLRTKLNQGNVVFEVGKRKTIHYVKNKLPEQTKSIFLSTKRGIEEKYATIIPNIRGNKVLSKDGKVSQFLKDISRHKKENGGGRIEE